MMTQVIIGPTSRWARLVGMVSIPLAAMVVCVTGSCVSGRSVDEPPRTQRRSPESPSPIEWIETSAKTEVSQDQALALAKQYTEFKKAAQVEATVVLLTDKEATMLEINRRPVWLVTMTGAMYDLKLRAGTETRGPVTWHIGIDAKSGDLVEAFTEPKPAEEWTLPAPVGVEPPPGWKPTTMAEGWKKMHASLAPAGQPPACTLSQALAVGSRYNVETFAQIIARYGRFSSPYPVGAVVHGEGGESLPLAAGINAWALAFVGGSYVAASGGPPGTKHPARNTEYNSIVEAQRPGKCERLKGFWYR